jgi:hypothetical protein
LAILSASWTERSWASIQGNSRKTVLSIEKNPRPKARGPNELAFWYTDDAYQNPDVEVLAAARPGLLTTRGPVIMASSPYARRGVLWDTYNKHCGPNGAPLVLVARGTTAAFNPTIPQEEIDREIERDPVRNRAEYLAEFRTDIESYISLDVVNACVERSVHERAPMRGVEYFAFTDPSGGSQDSFALAIGHYDHRKQCVVLDALREIIGRSVPSEPSRTSAPRCAIITSPPSMATATRARGRSSSFSGTT